MSETSAATARHRKSIWFPASILCLCLFGGAAVFAFGAAPVIRNGFPTFSDSQTYLREVVANGKGMAASDWVFVISDGKLIVSDLTPPLARQLAVTNVEIAALRDLPGVSPILLLVCLGIAALIMSHGAGPERLRELILIVLIVTAGTEFYLWLWTVAADHDMSTPLRYAHEADLRGKGLLFWRGSLVVQIPIWVAAMAILIRYLNENLEKRFIAGVLAANYAILTMGVLLLFRPEPYSRFFILSWWPLLFSVSVVFCGAVSLFALRRVWSKGRNEL